MVDIRPQDLNPAVTPIDADSPIIIDQGLSGVNRTTSTQMVNAVAPVVSQAEAEVGTDDVKRMTALKTKQSIASEVGVSVASYAAGQAGLSAVQSVNGKSGNAITLVKGDVGLGNVDNTSDVDKPISTATQTALNLKADKSVQIIATGGITGGGDIGGNVTVELDAMSVSSLAKADSAVQSVSGKSGNSITLVKGDVGLGNVDNTSDANKPVSTAQQTALNLKANTATQVIAGAGLTGGGDLSANRTVNVGAGTGISVAADAVALNAASIASLAKADTALQAPGGSTGQVLAKNSSADNDVAWVNSEAATAVSYGPQTLTSAQQEQARENIGAFAQPSGTAAQYVRGNGTLATLNKAAVGLGNVDNTSDAAKPISTATQDALDTKVNKSGDLMSGSLEFSGDINSQIRNQIGVTLANEAIISIHQSGILILNDFTSGAVGLFILGGNGGTTVTYLSPSPIFGTAEGTTGKINVFFWADPTPHYEIKNQTGSPRELSMLLISTRSAV